MNNSKEKKEELNEVHYFKISSSEINFQFLSESQYRSME